jgi:hypothetical protein
MFIAYWSTENINPVITPNGMLLDVSLSSETNILEKYSKLLIQIRVITKLPNSEQSYKGKVKTHNYINRQNQSTTGKL